MTARQRAGLAAATLAASAMLACGDPIRPVANFQNYADTLALYALNSAPRGAPTAIRILAGTGGDAGVTTDAGFRFDVAIDINAQGRPVLYPVRTIAAPFVATHRVGVRRTNDAFDLILSAPTTGYTYDSVAVLSIGEVVLIESGDPEACPLTFGGVIYGKMVVDSVNLSTGRVYSRITADPNCGFRSFLPGVPTD
jgi:hypothetical protein